MKKYAITALVCLATTALFAQEKQTNPPNATDTTAPKNKPVQTPPTTTTTYTKGKKDWSKVKLDPRRPQDHFMIELGYDNWVGATDSMNIKGFNHSENFYFMYAWPISKTDPRLTFAAGVGLGSSNIYFAHQEVLVAAVQTPTLSFPDEEGSNHYKRYKLTTTYLEIPLEIRFALDPEHMDHSWKFAAGMKLGLMMSAYTKGVDLVGPTGQPVANYTEKESSKQYFSGAEVTPTIRISKGVIGFFAQMHVTPLIKASAGPAVFPISGGVVLSGL